MTLEFLCTESRPFHGGTSWSPISWWDLMDLDPSLVLSLSSFHGMVYGKIHLMWLAWWYH
jgi:hypothetical protein